MHITHLATAGLAAAQTASGAVSQPITPLPLLDSSLSAQLAMLSACRCSLRLPLHMNGCYNSICTSHFSSQLQGSSYCDHHLFELQLMARQRSVMCPGPCLASCTGKVLSISLLTSCQIRKQGR